MGLLLITFLLFMLAMAGLAVSAITNGKPLPGSCGGTGVVKGTRCVANCSNPCPNKKSSATVDTPLQWRKRR